MTNNLKKHTILGIFSIIYSTVLFIWFSTIPGMLGTFNWHMEYRAIYIVLCVLLPLPLIFMILNQIFQKNFLRILLNVFSITNIVVWSLWFGALTGLTNVPVDNSNMNIIRQKEEIPSKAKADDEPELHLAFASDPHWGSSRSNAEARVKILKAVNSADYDAFYILGDIAEMGFLAGDFKKAVSDLQTYLPDTRFLTIPGNHDAILNGLRIYKSIFQEKGEKLYFRQDNGKVHMLFINMLWDSTELSRKEMKWLETQLQQIPQDETVIVISHCYVVSSGYYDSAANKTWGDLPDVMKKLCPLLEKYNVDLYLSGHDHFFEYLEKDDVNYLVLGAMGGALDDNLIYFSPYSQWLDNKTFGYVDMKIYDDYLTFDCISEDGNKIFTKTIETK